jgi:hypothetical protein
MYTNFWGSLNLMKSIYPIMSENSRIVFLSSMISQRTLNNFKRSMTNSYLFDRELSETNLNLTIERLEELAEKFITDYENNQERVQI